MYILEEEGHRRQQPKAAGTARSRTEPQGRSKPLEAAGTLEAATARTLEGAGTLEMAQLAASTKRAETKDKSRPWSL